MRSKTATYTLIIVLVFIAIFIVTRWQEPFRKEAFDRTPDRLIYSKHALCRMDCRKITREEIKEIMDHGVIMMNMTNRRDKPCPSYALQGETTDGDKIRVIFGQCNDRTIVITCYDLREDFECFCPGDEKKKK